jgi:hypothetical protein
VSLTSVFGNNGLTEITLALFRDWLGAYGCRPKSNLITMAFEAILTSVGGSQ